MCRVGVRRRGLWVAAARHVRNPTRTLVVLERNQRAEPGQPRAKDDRKVVRLGIVVLWMPEEEAPPLIASLNQIRDQQPVLGDQMKRPEESDPGRVFLPQPREGN